MKKMLLGFILLFAQVLFAQDPNSRVKFDPFRAKPGQEITITYNPEGSPLAGKKDIKAVVYTYENYVWQVNDLAFKEENGIWKANLKLSNTCGMLSVKFKSGELEDTNNGFSFSQMLIDDTGRFAPGGYAGWGLMRASDFGYGVKNYLEKQNISDSAVYFWLNQEISFHPKEASEALSVPFCQALFKMQGEPSLVRVNRVVAFLKKSPTEQNLMRLLSLYQHPLNNKTTSDSLEKVILSTYPSGDLARLKAYQQLNFERDFGKKIELCKAFLKQFPYRDADYTFNEKRMVNYTNVYLSMAIQAMMQKDYASLEKMSAELPAISIPTIYYKCIDIAHKRKDVDDSQLLAPARAMVKRMELFKNQRPVEYWFLSPNEWAVEYEKIFNQNLALTQIGILRNTGNFEEAMDLANRAQKYFMFKSAMLNNEQALLLDHFKKYDLLQEVLVKSMHENQSSPEMLDLLKKDYIRARGSENGFDTYVSGLKNPELASKELDELKSIMINKSMPDWTMKDGTGKIVKFKDLRGKTIVMDFWATWCVPCKASFPGMKLAVEKYKNDPNVVFFFVDTEERSPNYKQEIMQYIKENNYPFTVLFDNKLPAEKANDEVFNRICKAFSISGIPQKLIIDKNGKLRFITVGFKGSATGLADEISAMIELTKKAE